MQLLGPTPVPDTTPIVYQLAQSLAPNVKVDVSNETDVTLKIALGTADYFLPPNTTIRYPLRGQETTLIVTALAVPSVATVTVNAMVYNSQDPMPEVMSRGQNVVSLSADKITGGTITGITITGGTFQTATPPNPRVVMDSATANEILFYSGDPSEIAPGSVYVNTLTPGQLSIQSPQVSNLNGPAGINMNQEATAGATFLELAAQTVTVDGNLIVGNAPGHSMGVDAITSRGSSGQGPIAITGIIQAKAAGTILFDNAGSANDITQWNVNGVKVMSLSAQGLLAFFAGSAMMTAYSAQSAQQAQVPAGMMATGYDASRFMIYDNVGGRGFRIYDIVQGITKLNIDGNGLITTTGGIVLVGSPSGYSGYGEIRGNALAFATTNTGAPTTYFDHRGTGNTGDWYWRNGTAAANSQAHLDATGNFSMNGMLGFLSLGGAGNSATATAGGATLPASPRGFFTINLAGTSVKVPYYNI